MRDEPQNARPPEQGSDSVLPTLQHPFSPFEYMDRRVSAVAPLKMILEAGCVTRSTPTGKVRSHPVIAGIFYDSLAATTAIECTPN